ncbi:MAG: hypothetical protein M3Y33_01930 [Actinomycetota bacterium]|nr:hypothetical protein [Actinomycetota bacterium]
MTTTAAAGQVPAVLLQDAPDPGRALLQVAATGPLPGARGTLRRVLQVATGCGFEVDELATGSSGADSGHEPGSANGRRMVEVVLHVRGTSSVNDLATRLSELPSVRGVAAEDANATAR